MQPQMVTDGINLTDALRTVGTNSAYQSSRALSKWFKRGVRLTSNGFESVPIREIGDCSGDPEEPVAALHLSLTGDVTGDILLTFPEKVGLILVDLLIGAAPGTSTTYGELEQSCLQETANIVSSALANSLSNWLKLHIEPGPPTFLYDMAGAIVDPLLASQANAGDEALIARTEFELDGTAMDFNLLLLPSVDALDVMRERCQVDRVRTHALQTIAINGAFDASRAISKWLGTGVRLKTDGFSRIALREVTTGYEEGAPVVALHTSLGQQLHGHILMIIPLKTAFELVDTLMNAEPGTTTELDDMGRSCLQETGNIVSSSFINSWAKWLDLESEPSPPHVLVDHPEAVLQSVLVEQAVVSDEVFLSKAVFSMNDRRLEWDFYLLPHPSSLRLIEASCE